MHGGTISAHSDGRNKGGERFASDCLNGEPPSKKKVETALREEGFDFVHDVLTQAAFVWTDHTNGETNG